MILGQRVSYGGELCTIRYVGEVVGTKGEWLGVEWDDPTRGKHNGEAGGKKYFSCQSKEPKAASFIRPTRQADKERSFLEALRFKYASEHTRIIQIGQPQSLLDRPIRFSGKEAEEVGFDKIRKQQADLQELKIVLLDGLCVRQSVSQELLQVWTSEPEALRRNLGVDIRETCPKITELDLSRNLFTSLHDVAAICEQLEYLRILRLDGNRFKDVSIISNEQAHFKLIFAKVNNLSLDNTLLSWKDIVQICKCFPALKTLSISSNEFEALDTAVNLEGVPAITTIKLESNKVTSLASLAPLSKIPSLVQLHLKDNAISTVSAATTKTTFPNITFLDVSHNSITDWPFITSLTPAFPSLTSLRISHNPLYTTLHSPLGRELAPDDGYMLTIARLPHLKTLNFSAVTEKDRLNAETYYISLIVQELSLAPEANAKGILEKHPRWRELCEEYGEPVVKREGDHVDPRSLAARLLTLEVELSDEAAALFGKGAGAKATIRNVPKRFNIYSVLGSVARAFKQNGVVPGLSLSLITEDWEEVDGERVKRLLKLVPETRGIGTFVEERVGHVRVEYEEPVRSALEAYEHPVTASLIRQTLVA